MSAPASESQSDPSRDPLLDEAAERVLGPEFTRLGVSQRRDGETIKRTARKILLRGEVFYQIVEARGTKTRADNFNAAEMRAELRKMLDTPGVWELHVTTTSGDLHMRRTRKGRMLVSRSKPLQRMAATVEPHDRKKEQPLDQFDSAALLQAVGIAGPDNAIRASMRGKYDQINAFLREVGEVTHGVEKGSEFFVLDAGCGLAYLTFAAHAWLNQSRGLRCRAVGVDRNGEVVARASGIASQLPDLRSQPPIEFVCSDLADFQPDAKPDLVVSLHACDTATDEAIARAVEWGTRRVLCAPCCQHELHAALKHSGPMRGVLRHGILRERLCDTLTDAFRAQILRILGYRVTVAEFVAPGATSRNLMIRAEAGAKLGVAEAVDEYLALRDFWGVTPWLERRLAARLADFIGEPL